MKNIQFRISDKRYIGRKQINNKIITVYAKTQKECSLKLKKVIEELNNPELKNEQVKENYKFSHLYMEWYKNEKEPFITKDTQESILLAYKKLQPLHNLNIKSITKQTLCNFLKKFKDDRGKEKLRLYLNACLEYYRIEGIISVNPCANIKTKKSYTSKKAFTYEEQVKILQELENKKLKVIILIYLLTGLRRNELNFRSIENDIDIENLILKARNLKGRNFVVRYKQIKLTRKTVNLIMNNIDIIHNYSSEIAYREFAEILKKLNIKGSIVNLRHTFATNCFYLNKPELVISREMGHATSQVTKDIYTDIDYHLSADKIRKLYNNFYNEN